MIALTLGAEDTFTGVERIVAVGDVHGGFGEFTGILRMAGLIDKNNKWTGGAAHLVQTGDVLDRGPDSKKVLELLMSLEGQAKKAKGMVHSLIGNHEAMNIYGDLRYVSPKEYESYKTGGSAELRDRAYESMADPRKKDDDDYKKQWYKEHPLGWMEHRQAFATEGKFGKWMKDHNAVVKINDAIFLHGGISAKYASMTLKEMNQKIRDELADFRKLEGGEAMDEKGPLWYRGLATEDEEDLSQFVDKLLKAFGVKRVVIGHTPTQGAVIPRFKGKVLMIDVGLSKVYNDSPACLLIEEGKAYALHRGEKLELPEGGDVKAYLRRVAELEPGGSRLRKWVESGAQ